LEEPAVSIFRDEVNCVDTLINYMREGIRIGPSSTGRLTNQMQKGRWSHNSGQAVEMWDTKQPFSVPKLDHGWSRGRKFFLVGGP
jgi:hypothetical protein